MIYLDHAATTRLKPAARAAMAEGFALWANPSSPHTAGRRARAALEDAREQIKAALGWEGELIFTASASEAAALALGRANAGARLVSAVEHDCVLQAAPDAERLPVLGDGALDLEVLAEAVRHKRSLLAVQQVNSETGAVQDLAAIAGIVHDSGGLLLADCAQGAGKLPLPAQADMVILAAHKFGGPVGIGALLVRDYALLAPTGGQERGYRRGTENLPAALGMAAALATPSAPERQVTERFQQFGYTASQSGGEWLSGRLRANSGHIAAVVMPGVSAEAQLMRFDMAGIAVSQGSACSSGTMRRSHVLTAMGVPDGIAARTIRVSLGWDSTMADIDRFAEVWLDLAGR